MSLTKKIILLLVLNTNIATLIAFFPSSSHHTFGPSDNFGPELTQALLETGDALAQDIDKFGDAASRNMSKLFMQFNESACELGSGIETLGGSLGNAMIPATSVMVKGTAALTTIIVGGFVGTFVAKKYIGRYLYEPKLIERSSKRSLISCLNPLSYLKPKPVIIDDHMVISSELKTNLEYVMQMTKNIKSNGGQFDNILLYGPPGTGKTLFAELLAQHCGMDYAIIPAANISQFLSSGTAVEELNNLFEWAAKSPNGTLLFLDEAEVFLAERQTLNAAAQNALSAFLAKTGSPCNKILVMCTTNRPEILDAAVLSRFGMHIEFKLPAIDARIQQIKMHIKKVFAFQKGTFVDFSYLENEHVVQDIAERLEGFSGRTIQKCVNSFRQNALAQNILTMDASIIDQVIKQIKSNISK